MTLTILDAKNVLHEFTVSLDEYKNGRFKNLFPTIRAWLRESRQTEIADDVLICITAEQDGYAEPTDIVGRWLEPGNDTIWVDTVNEEIQLRIGYEEYTWQLSREIARRFTFTDLRAFAEEKFSELRTEQFDFILATDGKGCSNEDEFRTNFNYKFTNDLSIFIAGSHDVTQEFLRRIRTDPLSPHSRALHDSVVQGVRELTNTIESYSEDEEEVMQRTLSEDLRNVVPHRVSEASSSEDEDEDSEPAAEASLERTCPRLASQDPTCLICHEQLMTDNCNAVRQIKKCRHLFHAPCLEEWLVGHNTCPLCRARIS